MTAKRPLRLWEHPSATARQGQPVVPTPKVLPASRPRTDLEVCLELFASPPTRTQAINQLVATFAPDRRAAVRERWQARTLDGTPVAHAAPADLEIEAVALTGWALDRQHRGERNQGAWAWSQAAHAAHQRRAVPAAA